MKSNALRKVDDQESEDTGVSIDIIKGAQTPELIFALVGFIGTNIHSVAEELKILMENEYGYKCEIISLSSFIQKNKIDNDPTLDGSPSKEFERIKNLIYHGNALRKNHGNSILSELACRYIGKDRDIRSQELSSNKENNNGNRICYIIDSIKNPDELLILKEVYRKILYCIGVFSPFKIRFDNLLARQIEPKEIEDLIDQDNHEDISNGQDTRKTFTQSDYFLRIDSASPVFLEIKLKRFLHLIFGTAIITPTIDESAMYMAASAAVNSGCLSRQVGAAIIDKDGNNISVGWNDVPCFNGNLYKSRNEDLIGINDNRCMNFHSGECSNEQNKTRIAQKLVNQIIKSGINANETQLYEIIRNSDLKGLIEFSRAVHAEMYAIIKGSQKSGYNMIGSTLYSTTYPCHSCARHIVLAGITTVYFIEPYHRSLATNLHSDSITEDETDVNKVRLLHFDGVAPSIFMRLFKMQENSRKDQKGKALKPNPKTARPRYTETIEALKTLESAVYRVINKIEWNL